MKRCYLLAWVLTFGSLPMQAQSLDYVRPVWDFEEARQFDFWIGEWRVNNRFLQDEGTWMDGGSAQVKIFPILDGKAILEFWDGRFGNGDVLRGFSLRYFDTETQKWQLVLNWPGPNRPGFSELQGTFRHGRGDFFSSYTRDDSTEVLTRYTFADITPTSLRWNNGTSTDGGQSWRTNWIMEFTRTAEQPTWTPPGEPFHTFETGTRCTADEAQQFDFLEGVWTGTITDPDGTTAPAHLEAHRVLDGCAVFNVATYGEGPGAHRAFQLRSYLPDRAAWVTVLLDNQPGSGYLYQVGMFEGTQITMTGFVPSWYKGITPEALRKTTWTHAAPDTLHYEIMESGDGGQTWMLTATVDLKRE